MPRFSILRSASLALVLAAGCAEQKPATDASQTPDGRQKSSPGQPIAAPEAPSRGPTEPGTASTPATARSSTARSSTAQSAATARPVPAATPESRLEFPPPPVEAPIERTAKEGDGQWKPLLEGGEVQGRPVLYETTLHPHTFQPWSYVKLVAIDLSRTEIHLVAGTSEPANDSISKEERGGLVPKDVQERLVAVFNGGFKESHGHYGMRIGTQVYVKPKDGACTIALDSPSAVRIGTHNKLTIDEGVTFRQTPPCLLEDGKPHPHLKHARLQRTWGGAEDGRKDIRRSALGTDATGTILYFAFADWVTAEELTRALEAAGIQDAAELDINWSFTRFLFFGPAEDGSGLEVKKTLVEKVEHRKLGYVQKSEPRDFFYVLRRN